VFPRGKQGSLLELQLGHPLLCIARGPPQELLLQQAVVGNYCLPCNPGNHKVQHHRQLVALPVALSQPIQAPEWVPIPLGCLPSHSQKTAAAALRPSPPLLGATACLHHPGVGAALQWGKCQRASCARSQLWLCRPRNNSSRNSRGAVVQGGSKVQGSPGTLLPAVKCCSGHHLTWIPQPMGSQA
jgi:hypothetical protein